MACGIEMALLFHKFYYSSACVLQDDTLELALCTDHPSSNAIKPQLYRYTTLGPPPQYTHLTTDVDDELFPRRYLLCIGSHLYYRHNLYITIIHDTRRQLDITFPCLYMYVFPSGIDFIGDGPPLLHDVFRWEGG